MKMDSTAIGWIFVVLILCAGIYTSYQSHKNAGLTTEGSGISSDQLNRVLDNQNTMIASDKTSAAADTATADSRK